MKKSYVLQLQDGKFEDLYLCFCGYEECEPLHSYGPASRPNYILHYILSGKGIYQVGEQRYELGAGEGFLIEPEVLTFYQADGEEPWTYLWVGFSGKRAKEYASDLGMNQNQLIFRTKQGDKLQEILFSMLKHNKLTIENQYMLQSLLYCFFATLMKDVSIVEAYNDSGENLYVKRAVNFIHNNYAAGIKVTDVADYVCVSRSYLYLLFEENLGLSPQEYLTKFRISRARELLQGTEMSIEQVALSCGYEDALVFAKVFKRNEGMPPSVYRKVQRKKDREQLNKTFNILTDLENINE